MFRFLSCFLLFVFLTGINSIIVSSIIVSSIIVSSIIASTTVEVIEQTGNRTTGELVAFDNEKLTLKVHDVTQDFPVSRLNKLTSKPGTLVSPQQAQPGSGKTGYIRVELTDGSSVVCQNLTTQHETAILELLDNEIFPIALSELDSVRFVVVSDTGNTGSRNDSLLQEWRRFRRLSQTEDRIIVQTNHQSGSGLPTLDDYSGIICEINLQSVVFELDGERLPINRERVFGLFFAHQQATVRERAVKEPAFGQIEEMDGSLWNVSALVFDPKTMQFQAKTAKGIQRMIPLSRLRELTFTPAQNVIPLLQLSPHSIRGVSPLRWGGMEERDNPVEQTLQEYLLARIQSQPSSEKQGLSNATILTAIQPHSIPHLHGILINGHLYEEGYTLYAKTELQYTLDAHYTQLSGLVGIDDRLRPGGVVVFRILGDNIVLLDREIRGDEPAHKIQVDVQGIMTLTLVVDTPGGFQPGTRVNLVKMTLK